MIRVSARRLDLHALDNNEQLRIITGACSVQITSDSTSGTVEAGIEPTGAGEPWIAEGEWKNRWLSLGALHPLRIYSLTARRREDAEPGDVVIVFRDETPESHAARIPRQATRREGLLARIPRQRT